MIGERWGVSDAETALHYGADDVVPAPALQVWRGVTVHAAPERVWPWLLQLRLAPYSYDWIDNLGRRSPPELSDLSEPAVGDPFIAALGGRSFGEVVAVEPGHQITGTVLGAVMSYRLMPIGAGDQTRLLLKLVMAGGAWFAPLLAVGDLLMARRQLLNLAALAEGTTAAADPA